MFNSPLNSDKEIMSWMGKICQAFEATDALYRFRMRVGGIVGKSMAHVRALDTMLLDNDVLDYAKLIYKKKVENGTLLSDTDKLSMFFSDWNMAAATAMLT